MGYKLPSGCRCTLTFYYTSDATGADVTIDLAHSPTIPEVEAINVEGGLKDLPPIADDWRVMTDAEVAKYLKGQREGNVTRFVAEEC